MILAGLFTLGLSVVVYNYGFTQGYDAKEKDIEERNEFWKEVQKHGL